MSARFVSQALDTFSPYRQGNGVVSAGSGCNADPVTLSGFSQRQALVRLHQFADKQFGVIPALGGAYFEDYRRHLRSLSIQTIQARCGIGRSLLERRQRNSEEAFMRFVIMQRPCHTSAGSASASGHGR
jgi:hypothetical protein